MLKWALFFFILAVISGIFGFTGLADLFAGLAKIMFFIFKVCLFAAIVLFLYTIFFD